MSDPVEALFRAAEMHGIPMSAICSEAGVAQSTPSRWRADRNSATYATLKKLNAALDRLVILKRCHACTDTPSDTPASPGTGGEDTAPGGEPRGEAA